MPQKIVPSMRYTTETHTAGARAYFFGWKATTSNLFEVVIMKIDVHADLFTPAYIQSLGRVFTNAGRNVPALRMALSMFGTKRIMFGTDIPLREDIELQLRDIEELGLNAAELDALCRQCSAASRHRATE
jgi:hypothetical protein